KLGYYADFGAVDHLAAALREPFVYDGSYSPHRRRRHGGKSEGLPREKFVVAIQNHDQIGNRAIGDRLSTVITSDQLRLAAAVLRRGARRRGECVAVRGSAGGRRAGAHRPLPARRSSDLAALQRSC